MAKVKEERAKFAHTLSSLPTPTGSLPVPDKFSIFVHLACGGILVSLALLVNIVNSNTTGSGSNRSETDPLSEEKTLNAHAYLTLEFAAHVFPLALAQHRSQGLSSSCP